MEVIVVIIRNGRHGSSGIAVAVPHLPSEATEFQRGKPLAPRK